MLIFAVFVFNFVIPLVNKESDAANSFSAGYDSSLNADYSAGDSVAYNDGTPAELVSPGYGGLGSALNISGNQNLRYSTENNLNTSKGEIEMKFQLPEDVAGDELLGAIDRPSGLFYDAISEYYYVADEYNNRIVKTKIDGTGWTTYGSYGSGVGQFYNPSGIYYDAASEYVYIADLYNHRIVKTKMDGTGWTTYGSYGSGVGQFKYPQSIFYDTTSEYIYTTEIGVSYWPESYYNNRVVKTKIDGTGWVTIGGSGSYGTGVGELNNPGDVYYDAASEYLYIIDRSNNRIVKTKIDGTGWATYGTEGSGVGQFDNPGGTYYDAASEYLYIIDRSNNRMVKTKIDGTGWATYGTEGSGVGQFSVPSAIYYDSASEYIHVTDRNNNRIVKTKIDGTGWTTSGAGKSHDSFSGPERIFYDAASEYIYLADSGNDCIVKTKMDGTDRTEYGSYGSGVGQFDNPSGIYYDAASEYIYITDFYNHRIVKTKMDGTGWATYGTEGSGSGQFYRPRGIFYDTVSEYMYIADHYNDRIVKTKMDGTGWATYGSMGLGTGQFRRPSGIYYDAASEYIYLTDSTNARIVKTKINGSGWTTLGNFSYPSAIHFDAASEYLYVADSHNERIVKTKIDGTGWTTFGSVGSGVGQFSYLEGVFYDVASDYIYAADMGNSRIVKTKMDGTGWTSYDGDLTKSLLITQGSDPMRLFFSFVDGRFKFYPSEGGLPYILQSDPKSYAAGEWHTIKVTYNNTTGEAVMYLDGIEEVSANFGSWIPPTTYGDYFYIGSDPDADATYRVLNAPIDDLTLTWIPTDTVDPTNPDTITGYESSSKEVEIDSTDWNNDANPYFEFSGADDDSSGVRGYFVYFGTDDTADPFETSGLLTVGGARYFTTEVDVAVSGALTTGQTYYLLIKTQDNDLNVSDESANLFTYKYDAQAPDPPEYINVSPQGCSTADTFTFTWPNSEDQHSGTLGYEYKKGSFGTIAAVDTYDPLEESTVLEAAPYQDSDNVFYARTSDNAGNVSSWQTAVYCSTGRTFIIDGPSVVAGPSSINVSWVSSKLTTGYVQVYDGNNYVSDQGRTSYEISHSIKVVGLEPDKAYRYKLVWSDEEGNLDESDWFNTNTAITPRILDLKAEIISPTSAIVSWNTNYNSVCSLNYGIGSYSETTSIENSGKGFSTRVDNLAGGSTYLVAVNASVEEDDSKYSTGITLETPPLPEISNLRFESQPEQASQSLFVTWNTNVDTTSSIFYKQSSGSYKEISSSDKVTEHGLTIPNLTDSTTYQLYAYSIDNYGNTTTSDTNTFQTPLDSRPPTISDVTIETSNVGLGNQDEAQIVVSWKTDEPATSFIEYGEGIKGDEYNFKTTVDPTFTMSHLVIISGLKESTPYHLHVASTDKGDNTSYSTDNTVIPGEVRKSILNFILDALSNAFGWLGAWF